MKNIIFILIDCFDYEKIGSNSFRNSPTPFLDSLKKSTYWASKMYSQGPYTEAALIATMCGYDTLTNGGYLKRYKNCPETLFETMQRAGYHVYAQMWAHFYPTSALRGIDDVELRPFSFPTLWSYRLQYYAELYEQKQLEVTDWNNIIDLLSDNLQFWSKYYQMILRHDPQVSLMLSNMSIGNISESFATLQQEMKCFSCDNRAYAEEILIQKTSHILFKLFSSELLDNKVKDSSFVEEVSRRCYALGRRIYRINNQRNRRNNRLSVRKLLAYYRASEHPLNLSIRTPFSQYIRNYYHVTHNKDLLASLGAHYDRQKDWLSLRGAMAAFMSWEKRYSKTQPYFAYLHTEDIHGKCALLDYCCSDMEEITAQIQNIESYLEKLPKDYRGNLGYDLALLNIDRQIEWFYKQLQASGKLENTTLVITSDHGCGTNYFPLRGLIQNFHDECYHVPFIIVDTDIVPQVDNRFHETKDILPTLAELSGILPPESANGISVFSQHGRSCICQEYMGPGCPDIERRPIWFCAFDSEWKVFIKVGIHQEFDKCIYYEIFHRAIDPLEETNLCASKEAQEKVSYLMDVLRLRFNSLRANYSKEDIYGLQ